MKLLAYSGIGTIFLSVGGSCWGQPSITGLGAFSASGMSGDGSVVVGTAIGNQAVRWTTATGAIGLGMLPGRISSVANGVSADGSVVVGTSRDAGGVSRAFRWTSAGMTDLGSLAGPHSEALAVSGDGQVVVGDSGWAFRWTSAGGMQSLPQPADPAFAVNGDGSVIAGQTFNPQRAFRWTSGGGLQDLGVLLSGGASSAYGMNTAGNVIVGRSTSAMSSTGAAHAFRWTAETGMQDLGQLQAGGFGSSAKAVSADGTVIVGNSYVWPDGWRAMMWAEDTAMVNLNAYLPTLGVDLTGWTLEYATGISSDGTRIVGNGIFNGATQAWMVTIPSPSGAVALTIGGAICLCRRRRK